MKQHSISNNLIKLQATVTNNFISDYSVNINNKDYFITSIKFYDPESKTITCTMNRGLLYSNYSFEEAINNSVTGSNKNIINTLYIEPYTVYSDKGKAYEDTLNSFIERGINTGSNFIVLTTNPDNFYPVSDSKVCRDVNKGCNYQCILFLAIKQPNIILTYSNYKPFNLFDNITNTIYKNILYTYNFSILSKSEQGTHVIIPVQVHELIQKNRLNIQSFCSMYNTVDITESMREYLRYIM